ncbi:MAG: hypothetical protein M3N43_12225 [Actinomycetota bacterium]|nr:hypothetical protein [Actinomycetota bacterium]
MLDALDESASQITHIGVHTLTDPGTGTNANAGEATGGSPAYARQAVTWGAASGRVKANSGTLTFDVPSGTYGYFTLWNNATGNTGNYRGHIPFGGSNALRGFFSVDTTLANDALLSASHGMSDGDRVTVYNVFSEALPTGLSEGTVYYVVSSTSNSFKVSTTLGGSAVDITGVGGGEGYWQRLVPETFGSQGQITVAVSALALDASAF